MTKRDLLANDLDSFPTSIVFEECEDNEENEWKELIGQFLSPQQNEDNENDEVKEWIKPFSFPQPKTDNKKRPHVYFL